MIHLHSLGQCMITLASARLLPTARLMFASALYVAVEGTRSIAREQMASLLWPEMTEDRATHALRQMFYRMRTYGMQLDGDAKEVVLPAGSVHRDYDALLAEEGSGATDRLLERIPGGFLPGYMPTVSVPFAEWVEGHRARVNASLRRQLVAGIAAQRAAGNWPATQALAQRCLQIDPLNEEATLANAEAMAMDGSKALAIMQIDRYMNEIGPRAKELHLPATMLRKRISELYPLPPVIERDPPHTGRDREMGLLDAAMLEVRQGHGRAFVISGPPGIGKTRLATEFTRAAQLRGLRVARTAMGRRDDHRPLGAWSDLVREMRRMPGALGCEPESLPFLERLTSGVSKETPRDEELDPEYLFARIRLAIVDLVCAVATESALILWIEDVHWMDEWSWDVMSVLTKKFEKAGVMVLMTRRESEEPGTPIPAEALLERVELGPLDDTGCRRLLALVDTRPKRMDEEFAEWCVRTCAGNPYFLIELARRASRSDGRFQAPPSLTKLIAQRFEDVAPLSRRVLQSAAVLGRNSTLPRIEKVLDERRVSLLASLDELTAHGLLVAEGESVLCRHDLLGMSALSGVSELSLKLLHRHAAATLEREIDAETTPDFMWDCAEHWEKAGEREKAVELVERCAVHAIALGVPEEAVRVLEAALKWNPADSSSHTFIGLLMRALHVTRDGRRLIEVAETINRARPAESTRAEHSEVELYQIAAVQFTVGPSVLLLEKALGCAADVHANPDHRVEAAMMACKFASNVFRPDLATAAFEATLHVSHLAHPILRAELAIVYEGSFGSIGRAVEAATEICEWVHQPLGPARRVPCLELAAAAFRLGGHVDLAVQRGLEAVELCDRLGLRESWEIAVQGVIRTHLASGDLEEAESLLSLLNSSAPTKSTIRSDNRLEYAARIALLRGDDEGAKPLLAQLYSSAGVNWTRAATHRVAMLALPRLRSEGWRPSDEEMADLLRLHRAARSHNYHDFFVYVLTFALVARGESSQAIHLYQEYIAKYRRELAPVLAQLRDRMELMSRG